MDEFLPIGSQIQIDRDDRIDQVSKRQQFYVKDGERFEKDERVQSFPLQHSFPMNTSNGEIHHYIEPFDVVVLTFLCYSEEEGFDEEIHRIRSYKMMYHLSDDTISLEEPKIENSGSIQGRVFRHQKVPNNTRIGGPFLHWRDLNIGIDINMFGRIYRITSCDRFTKKFLENHGIKLNREEETPIDPWYIKRRRANRLNRNGNETEHDNDIVEHGFISRPSILTFRCCWMDNGNDYSSAKHRRIFRLLVYTYDDSVTLIEETPFFEEQLFLKRTRLPCPKRPDGVRRFYRSCDFVPGVWIEVFTRNMFIYECIGDETTNYMRQQVGQTDYSNCSNDILREGPPPLQFLTAPERLSFLCRMIDAPALYYGSDFILIYDVNNRRVDINEAGIQRKWSQGRPFLTHVDASTFSENEFCVGRIVQFFKWRFHLVEADKTTAEYIRWKEMK